jgi:hypothetical protein
MANPERGEVDLVAGESVYTLALTMNGICELEARTGKSYGELVQAISFGARLHMTTLIEMTWQCLKRHHDKQFPTRVSVANFVEDLPRSYGDAVDAISKLLVMNAERRAGKNGNGNGADPPIAQN